jgi:hypothetical protein
MNYEQLLPIIKNIGNESIRNFTIACLQDAPKELETIPASVSGKFHPPKACEEGGLIWHIKRTCYFANMFFNSFKWKSENIKGDIVLSALLLHDICKKGAYGNYWEYVDHPTNAAKFIEKHKNMLPEKIFKIIQNCVMFHMGPFGPKKINKEMEEYKFLELIVYQCDYLASQQSIKIEGE